MRMCLELRLPPKMHLCRSSSNVPRLPSFLQLPQNHHVLLTFGKVRNPLGLPQKRRLNNQKWCEHMVHLVFSLRNVLRATTACMFSTSQLPKAVRTSSVSAFCLQNMLCATTTCTFSTSQLPKVVQTCGVFSANCQKYSDTEVFLPLWHRNVLRATAACTSCTSQVPKVPWRWSVFAVFTLEYVSCRSRVRFSHIPTSKHGLRSVFLSILTSTCASRHSGAQF